MRTFREKKCTNLAKKECENFAEKVEIMLKKRKFRETYRICNNKCRILA